MKQKETTFKPLEQLTFADDYMFSAVMRDPLICAGVIERLLKIKVAKIQYVELQKQLKSAYVSKGVRLDVYVKDSDRVYDIEIQTYKEEDVLLRLRYYQSMIDTDHLLRGYPYTDLPESYILFISRKDPFNKGLSCYTFKTLCSEEETLSATDKTTKVIYNASAYETSDDKELKAFLRFVSKNEASDNFTSSLAEKVASKINDEKFRREYLRVNLHEFDIRREAKEEGIAQGLSQGRADAKQESARNALALGISLEQVSKITGLTADDLQKLSGGKL